ncbi:MAG: hypothetical protein ACXAB8_17155 [Promethearchaeota archaeon]|jgi:hypothetical protein
MVKEFMRCKLCLKKENLYMCFLADENKEVYLCARCLGKQLLDNPYPVYNMSKLGYTWKNLKVVKKETN